MQLRVNIRKLKQLMWLLCAAAIAFAAWTFYDIYTAKTQGRYEARRVAEFETILKSQMDLEDGSQKTFYPQARFESLWKALVAREIAPVESAVDAPVEKAIEVPDISSVLKVRAVLFSNEPAYRFAAITYANPTAAPASGKTQRLHLSEGDPLKPPYDAAPYFGKVLRIGQQEVAFSWGGAEAVVTPKLGSDGTGIQLKDWSVAQAEDPTAGLDEAPENSVQLGEGEWVIGWRDIEKVQRDPQAFLAEELNVRTVTMPKGERTRLELVDVKEGSLAHGYGARAGDKVISVNGIPMSSVSGAINWFKQNPNLPTYTIVYERAGQEHTLTIHVK